SSPPSCTCSAPPRGGSRAGSTASCRTSTSKAPRSNGNSPPRMVPTTRRRRTGGNRRRSAEHSAALARDRLPGRRGDLGAEPFEGRRVVAADDERTHAVLERELDDLVDPRLGRSVEE